MFRFVVNLCVLCTCIISTKLLCVDILNISMFEFSTELGNCSDLSSVLFCDHKHVGPCMHKHINIIKVLSDTHANEISTAV